MEILADRLDWTTVDEENLSKFLDTETGKRFLPRLLESTPPLLAKGEINEILIRTGEVRAYADLARTILSLAHSAPVARTDTASAYHPLEDDAAWNDGQTLTPEPKKEKV